MATETTRRQRTTDDLVSMIRAVNTVIWISSREEIRVERAILDAARVANRRVRFWDCVDGITDEGGASLATIGDPAGALRYVKDTRERGLYVLRDLHKWMGDPTVLRGLRNLARALQKVPQAEARAIVILSPSNEIPPELADHVVAVDFPLPDRAEIAALLADMVDGLAPEVAAKAAPNGTREAAIDAAVGLTSEEAASCYSRSLVTTGGRIDPAIVSAEKKRVIAREKVLTWYDPDPRGLDAIGGLDVLKGWLANRRAAFSARARAYGLPAPRGAMLVGVPGCGKSLTAKAIAAAWSMPLLRLDLGALKSKWVGESEANIRKALAVAETVSPCVLWIDEVEKALGGSTGPQGDGGVAADALGAVLSWMQERSGAVFVIATANDVRALPPELLRKGRFDEVFWVDLPQRGERAAIAAAALRAHGRTEDVDLQAVAIATEGFTGAEIAALVPDALFAAFGDGERPISTADLVQAAATVTPLAKTAAEKIDALRAWAQGRARPASTPERVAATGSARAVEI